ncbi:MAG TPA: hypothetical protein DCP31_40705, partial [Cyanobacteria bacterium UBA8543]|nr:hypothetical protein [Cyanobacteria bacterium UBA8543]
MPVGVRQMPVRTSDAMARLAPIQTTSKSTFEVLLEMTVEEALEIVEKVLNYQRLNKVQQLVFRQSWEGHSYMEIAKNTGYELGYIKDTGSKLWQLLSLAFEEKVTKNNLSTILKRYSRQNQTVTAIPVTSHSPSDDEWNGKESLSYANLTQLNESQNISLTTEVNYPHQDWGEAIDISTFYGRTVELTELEHWIVTDRCRIVTILGMGGIGKTSLSVKLAEQIQPSFEYLIWRSLRNAPPVQELLADLIEFLSDGQETELQPTVEGRVSQLIEYLRKHRCLLLLDDVEIVLRSGGLAGQYREGYQGYGELIRRVGQERHQSCLVLTSREKPIEIASLAGATLPVRALRVKGLPKEDARKILEAKGFSTLKRGWEELIALYRGNPLALKIIATTIQEIFNGDISQFLDQSTLVLGDILPSLLYQQFERLSDLEKGIIYCVAIETEPISIPELKSDLRFSGASLSELLSALESLKRRSLLEEEPSTEGSTAFLTLQPVIRKYVTNQLIEQVCKDILTVAKNQSIDKLG